MRPRERRETSEQDLFRSRLDQIIDMKHALVKLSQAIAWGFLEQTFGAVYTDKPGQPPSLTRWRQRMGQDKLKALLQESLAVATRTEAMKPSDLARVVIDTTVQPKA